MAKVFGGKTCNIVSRAVGASFENYLVFSICSDERLPDELDEYLRNLNRRDTPTALIVVGDFTSSEPLSYESPASYEAIRMIQEASESKTSIKVCWLDGDLVRSSIFFPEMHWIEFHSRNNQFQENKDLSLTKRPDLSNTADEKSYNQLCELLNFSLFVRVENERITAVDLTDNKCYQRGLLNSLSLHQQQDLWRILLKLTSLKKIRASFNGLKFIPDLSGLHQLEDLDIRGNPGIELSDLHSASELIKLNISACNLDRIPSAVQKLRNLRSLLAYKNTISDISNIKFPVLLERLSLYRNEIKNTELNLDYCHHLKELNLGANPLRHMNIWLPHDLKDFTLKDRHVEDCISISFRSTKMT
jgi:Leucine-rich repeat (LRR) protein